MSPVFGLFVAEVEDDVGNVLGFGRQDNFLVGETLVEVDLASVVFVHLDEVALEQVGAHADMDLAMGPDGQFIASQDVDAQHVGLLKHLGLGVQRVLEKDGVGLSRGFLGKLGGRPILDTASVVGT